MQNNYETRNTFPSIETKKLKQLYNASRSIKTLAVLWILGTLVFSSVVVYLICSPQANIADRLPTLVIIPLLIVLNVFTVVGCLRWTTWGRVLGIICCVLMLAGFPIGTLIGILGLVAFIKSPQLFGADRLDPDQLIVEYKMRKSMKARPDAAPNP